MATVFCLDCGASICLDLNTKVGQRLTCPHCSAELEVIDTSPLELDWAYDEPLSLWDSEDWDDGSDVDAGDQGQAIAGEKLKLPG